MRRSAKTVALCGCVAALCTTLMLTAYFPYFTYAVPALSGALMIVPLYELGKKPAIACYCASLLPVFLFCETEAKTLYLLFFGFYPVVKSLLERLHSRVLEYILKILLFNFLAAAAYAVAVFVLGLPMEETGWPLRIFLPAFALLANGAFILYDICLTRVCVFYAVRLHPQIKRLFFR